MPSILESVFNSPPIASPKKRASASTDATTASDESSVSLTSRDLPESVAKSIPAIYDEKLTPIDLRFGAVRQEDYDMTLVESHHKVMNETMFLGKAKASICFVVRRPGCLLCHEQGMALSSLISQFDGSKIAAWGVVKEIDVDNEGLLTLYQDYFKYPFFLDSKLRLYRALGDRRANIFTTLLNFRAFKERLTKKNIIGDMIGKGEGFVLGGIIVFDAKGEIRYAYLEQAGEELPVESIRSVLDELVRAD